MLPRSVVFECRPSGWRRWFVPVAPVSQVTAAARFDVAGAWVALSLTGVRLEMAADEPQVVWPEGWLDALDDGAPVRFTLTAGHEAATRPPGLAQAVLLIAKTWYDAGIAIEDDKEEAPQPFGARALMRQLRYERPHVYGDWP